MLVFPRVLEPLRQAGRIARWLPLALAAGAGAAALGYRYLLRRPLPETRGELRLVGLDRDVEVLRDRWGVPHVYAQTAHDLFYAQGYVHAQDRLWQMDLLRRVGSGTLAEVVGEEGLETDRFFRRVGLRRSAAVELEQLEDESRQAVAAYAEGVNAFLAGHAGRLPVEFTLLRFQPAPWTSLDTLTWAKLMSWLLSANWDTELTRAHLIDRVGPEAAAAVEPAYPEGNPISAAPEVGRAAADGFVLAQFREAQRYLRAVGAGAMSNAWAVDGSRSSTGKPLLANDPHLQPAVPGFWHEIHLSGAGYDVAGVGVPGVPGVVVGHNQRIAWGITMSFADTQDLYVERLNPVNPRQYEFRGRWEDARVIREEIRVKGRRGPVVEEVLVTRHGPIVSPLFPGEERALAIRAATQEPGQPGAALALDRAGNWTECQAALANWSVATLNFAYADVDGNVGYQLAGRIPIRAKGDGLAPAPGWTGEHEWVGFIPPDELPGVLNPPTHHVATANNRVCPDGYPYLISREWGDGYRARRICDLLDARDRHDAESFKAMQADVYSIPAREFREHLIRLTPKDRVAARALELVRDWDCRIAADSPAAALYEVWRHYLLRNVFGAKLGDQLDHYLGLGHESLIHTTVYQIRVSSHLLRLLRERPADWFGGGAGPNPPSPPSPRGKGGTDPAPPSRDWKVRQPSGQVRQPSGKGVGGLEPALSAAKGQPSHPCSWDEALQLSLRQAVLLLRASLGDDPTRWRWGDLHTLTFKHVLGIGALGRVLNYGPYPMAGDADTVCASNTDVAAPFLAHGSIVSYRQIVDLADFDRSLAILPGGQSGHPGSPHYRDQTALWYAGQYHPMPFTREAVVRATVDRLTIHRACPERSEGMDRIGKDRQDVG